MTQPASRVTCLLYFDSREDPLEKVFQIPDSLGKYILLEMGDEVEYEIARGHNWGPSIAVVDGIVDSDCPIVSGAIRRVISLKHLRHSWQSPIK